MPICPFTIFHRHRNRIHDTEEDARQIGDLAKHFFGAKYMRRSSLKLPEPPAKSHTLCRYRVCQRLLLDCFHICIEPGLYADQCDFETYFAPESADRVRFHRWNGILFHHLDANIVSTSSTIIFGVFSTSTAIPRSSDCSGSRSRN